MADYPAKEMVVIAVSIIVITIGAIAIPMIYRVLTIRTRTLATSWGALAANAKFIAVNTMPELR